MLFFNVLVVVQLDTAPFPIVVLVAILAIFNVLLSGRAPSVYEFVEVFHLTFCRTALYGFDVVRLSELVLLVGLALLKAHLLLAMHLVRLRLVVVRIDGLLTHELSSLIVANVVVGVAFNHLLLVVLIDVDIVILGITALGLTGVVLIQIARVAVVLHLLGRRLW